MIYILFLLTGVFCFYFIIVFFQGTDVDDGNTVIDFSPSSSSQSSESAYIPEPLTTNKRIDDIEKEIKKFERKLLASDIPISKTLSAKLLQYYNLERIDTRDIFWFYVFGDLPVSAYSLDTARLYAFGDPYYLIQKNMYLLDAFFEFNETNTFFGSSFFLNAKQEDGIVRFIFELEWKVYGVEVLRTEYEALKKALNS